MFIYALVPAAMMAGGRPFLLRFPIDRSRRDQIRAALEARLGQD